MPRHRHGLRTGNCEGGPVHVVFLELVIDPVSSFVFEAEAEETGIMARPPRRPDAPLFDTALLLRGLSQGVWFFSPFWVVSGWVCSMHTRSS